MALSIVQSATRGNGSGGTTPYAPILTSAPTVGNLVVISARVAYTTTDWTFSTANYTKVAENNDTTGKTHLYWATRVVQAGDTATLPTLLSGTAGDAVSVFIWEISGQATSLPTDGTSLILTGTSTSITTTVANDLLLAASLVGTQTTPNWTTDVAGGGFTPWTGAHFTGSTAATGSKTSPTWSASGVNTMIGIKPAAASAAVLESLASQFRLLGLWH